MTELERGAGRGQIVYVDCFSGVSGDMFLSAMLDLGVPVRVIEEAVGALPLSGYRIRVETEMRQGLQVTRFHVDMDATHQPHRHFSDIARMIEEAPLRPEEIQRALAIFQEIAVAEAAVHGTDVEHVHFHEVGAVDSIVDIVGAAVAIEFLQARFVSRPVPLGRGFVETRHGTLPVPAPATIRILQGVPVEGTDVEAELATPTGAAILKNLVESFGPMPLMKPLKTGMGAGARTRPDRPGILRMVLGTPVSFTDSHAGSCMVIEANIDDMTGELAADAAGTLLGEGALDVWMESIIMKKGRPAIRFSVLCRTEDLARMGALLMGQTTTIGLRYYPVGRMEMERSTHLVETPYGSIRVKVSRWPLDKATNAAPEFEDCRNAALLHRVPVKQVIAAALGEASRLVFNN